LADDVNFGYNQLASLELIEFNKQKVKNMKHLFQLINDNEEEFLRFDFTDNIFVVLEKKHLATAGKRIKSEYSIPANYSDDLITDISNNIDSVDQKSKKILKKHSSFLE